MHHFDKLFHRKKNKKAHNIQNIDELPRRLQNIVQQIRWTIKYRQNDSGELPKTKTPFWGQSFAKH